MLAGETTSCRAVHALSVVLTDASFRPAKRAPAPLPPPLPLPQLDDTANHYHVHHTARFGPGATAQPGRSPVHAHHHNAGGADEVDHTMESAAQHKHDLARQERLREATTALEDEIAVRCTHVGECGAGRWEVPGLMTTIVCETAWMSRPAARVCQRTENSISPPVSFEWSVLPTRVFRPWRSVSAWSAVCSAAGAILSRKGFPPKRTGRRRGQTQPQRLDRP